MDDRDFIYWLYGIFEFGDFETLKPHQVEIIVENICEVYDNVQKQGLMNDLDAMRVMFLIEGSLMYYEEAPLEHKIKVCNLIKNEITDIYHRLRSNSEKKLPLYKTNILEIYPLMTTNINGLHDDFLKEVKKLGGAKSKKTTDSWPKELPPMSISAKEADDVVSLISKIFDGIIPKPAQKSKPAPSGHGTDSKKSLKEPDEEWMSETIKDEETATEAINSLDSIADKIASRAV